MLEQWLLPESGRSGVFASGRVFVSESCLIHRQATRSAYPLHPEQQRSFSAPPYQVPQYKSCRWFPEIDWEPLCFIEFAPWNQKESLIKPLRIDPVLYLGIKR